MGNFSFKSVGKTSEQKTQEVLYKTQLPVGIKTPLQFGGPAGLLSMSYSLQEQIPDNLRNLLLTNWGERLGLYNFGANLRPLTTELVSQDDFDAAAMERIKTAVSTWMPYVNLDDYSSFFDRENIKNTAIVNLTITYSVPALQITNKAIQITLYAI